MTISNTRTQHTNTQTIEKIQDSAEFLTLDQLREIMHIFDQSDVTELVVKDSGSNTHLVLRKATGRIIEHNNTQPVLEQSEVEVTTAPEQTNYTITATLVGVFHSWSGTKEKKPLIKIGDHIKKGQHIGIIQALNIANEVESPVAGQVIEILVEDGQGVEYGQPLIIVDTTLTFR
jgi:acetyl-CoA carboxylase biotin carboxyl carrier protein